MSGGARRCDTHRVEGDMRDDAVKANRARCRPQVAEGSRGWGQQGTLDLDLLRSLRKQARKAA